jgi:hypothetical protein
MIGNSAMLVELNMPVWTARKMDKNVSKEVDIAKGTKTRAGNYHKKLLAGAVKLDDIQRVASAARTWHYANTLPWSDNGARLLPMKNFFEYKQTLNDFEQQFNNAVDAFITEYPTLVSSSAFTLGGLFDREEYPDVDQVRSKFAFRYMFSPVPDAGDFRVDVEEQTKKELQDQYAQHYKNKLQEAMNDAWKRLHDTLTHMSERLDYTDENKKKFWDSMFHNATDLCGLLSKLNVSDDPKLEQARRDLERALSGVDPSTVRESQEVRETIKKRVDNILSMF